ncbi:flavodoxin [Paenibacillus sp. alder61]|uniref:Flavodoxin n=1 Tax=Paenibacillus faecis TaxID=862114 RepID=A0A5D0CKJ3_9BACL|nr:MULTISPECIES: flavodoxin [Paenibacillus]MCA1292648.1 flavodoxin [Paenibacillus sp. alder61]TYA10456.1 flavodoxin [Paenibacillus faecis]
MSKIIIVYASLTGNTEEMAELIAEGIRDTGVAADLKMVEDCSAALLLEYDGYLLGTYTWGDGELPDEFTDFADELEDIRLQGGPAAVFGSGDTTYRLYCGAVDELEGRLRKLGASIVQDSLKVEYGPSPEEKGLCREFGVNFARSLEAVSKK